MLSLQTAGRWFLLVVLVLVAGGCASARKRVDGDIVHKVQFEGLPPPFVRPFSKAELRAAMAQKQSGLGVRTPGLTWAARAVPLDEDELESDAYRLETWLAHHGYLDARVEGFWVERRRPQKIDDEGYVKKAGIVVVHGRVTFGEPSTIREVDVVWADKEADRYWRTLQEGITKRTGYAQPGSTFNLDSVDYTVQDLIGRMKENGFIHADASVTIDAYPEEHAVDVTIEARTGPATTVGSIEITGNERLTDEQVREVLDLEVGQSLNSKVVAQAQQRLIGTNVFSLAQVEPDTSDPTVARVPVRVNLKEAQFGTARAGGGVVYDGTTITPRLTTTLEHVNIDGDYARLETSANVGAGIPLQGGIDAAQWLYGASVGIIKPRAFGKKWDTNAELSYQRDLLAGQLLYTRMRLNGGFTHRFSDSVFLNFGPSAEITRLGAGYPFTTSDARLAEFDKLLVAATFGGDPDTVRNPFLLPMLEARLTMDWRKGESGSNVALDPRGGYYYQFAYRQAIPFRSGGYKFSDLYGDARFYRSLLSRNRSTVPYTLALRLKGRYLPGSADTFQSAIPYSERAFLGGSFDMRGFRIQQVGPYDCVCLAQEEAILQGPFWPFVRDTGGSRLEANPTFLPRGGRFSGLVSGEIRRRWPSGRGVALFGDVGILARSVKELMPENLPHSLRWDVGIGFRQQTPIGPVRIDLAFRPGYPEDGAPQRAGSVVTTSDPSNPAYYQGQYYGCDEIPAARLPERATGFSPFGTDGPVIINLAIAIGEAL